MGDVEIPPGIMPVFLTMTTQEMFKVVSGEDVTPEMPYKRVNIAAILKEKHASLREWLKDMAEQETNDGERLQHDTTLVADQNAK